MSDDNDVNYGDYGRQWDEAEYDEDQPSSKNWRELLVLSDEERLKERMKRYRSNLKILKDVKIEEKLMPLLLNNISNLKYKNPEMLILGYSVINGNMIDTKALSNVLSTIGNKDDIKLKANIIRYARLILSAINLSKSDR